ncbi:GNAT family N-acetyltransferase [Curvivirga aplysinae]|uniref:GNAT family N-acetyltransferase n=1 Tax=Curvivirga aplysinae TaxID=2529852 RepID=UPI001F3EF1FF|nr:GNAT family N-acetyltransferase [Curvivirga aplysinae]
MAILDADFQYMPEGHTFADVSGFEPIRMGNLEISITEDPEVIYAAQQLRYEVFYEEGNATPSSSAKIMRLDRDRFDAVAEHLVVIDHDHAEGEKVVGTYRLLRKTHANKLGGFYTSHEYDIGALVGTGKNLLELGRSCVHRDYRNKKVMDLLWRGLAEYVLQYDIDFMFGCASFQGVEIDRYRETLSYLHHFHMARMEIRPRALPNQYVPMNWMPMEEIDPKRAIKAAPPLIKGYLRAGAVVGDGAVVDQQFDTTDICIIVETERMSNRYKKHYIK